MFTISKFRIQEINNLRVIEHFVIVAEIYNGDFWSRMWKGGVSFPFVEKIKLLYALRKVGEFHRHVILLESKLFPKHRVLLQIF